VFGDAELLLLYWHDTDGDDGQNAAYTGSRYTLGYMNGCGRAFRVRWFEYASVDEVGGGDFTLEHLDLEYAGRFKLGCNWKGALSLGARWAQLRTPQVDIWQDTIGPLAGIEIRSEITRRLSLYGKARQSFQFGREVTGNQPHDTFAVSEMAIGAEISQDICTSSVFFRTGLESQYYQSIRDDEEDYGLIGLSLVAGLRR
jgi:hypothetical protein